MKKLQVLKRKSGFTVFLCAMVVMVALAGVGCGGGGGGGGGDEAPVESPDVTSPYVTSRMPDMNETGVAVNSEIRVVFSEYMDNNTLTTDMFFISKNGQPVSGSITYNAGTAAFRPSASLEYSTVYTVTLKSSVADVSGNSMGQDIIWQFTTASAPAPEIEVLKGLTAIPSGTANVHDFGGVTVGNNSSQVTFTVRNTGSADLLMNGSPRVQSSSSEFTIDSQPSSPVTGGDETTFTVTFRPSTTGSKTATITILSNDSNEGTYTFTVKGTATPVPEPEIHVKKGETDVPSGATVAHDFGSVIIGQSGSTVTFRIQNIGTADLNLTGTPRVTSSNSEFIVETQPDTPVDDGDETTFTVKFSPQNTGSRSATITIISNDSDEGSYTFTVIGTGSPVPAPEINVVEGSTNVPNGGSVDFGTVLAGNTITKSFTIQNLGNASLSLTGNPVVEISGDDAGCFTVQSQPSSPIGTGMAQTFVVSFSSNSVGDKNANMLIRNNDGDESMYSININGKVMPPSGELDLSFGVNGIVRTSVDRWVGVVYKYFSAEAYDVCVQDDGRIILAGSIRGDDGTDFAIVRFNPDGSLDTSFGIGGIVQIDLGGEIEWGRAVTIQSDNRIVVVGRIQYSLYDNNGFVIRLNADGSIDESFNGNGIVEIDYNGESQTLLDMAIDENGNIFAIGSTENYNNLIFDVMLVKILPNGMLDQNFGTNGVLISDPGGIRFEYPNSIVLQQDGKIVISGYYENENGYDDDVFVVRYNQDGSIDNSFGINGYIATNINAMRDHSSDLAIDLQGKIIVSGYSHNGVDDDFLLLRYNSDGSLDSTFGNGGVVMTDVSYGSFVNNYSSSIIVQNDGKIVLFGLTRSNAGNPSGSDYTLLRYNQDGSLDTDFSNDGFANVDVDYHDKSCAAVFHYANKIVVGGFCQSWEGTSDFLLLRFWK